MAKELKELTPRSKDYSQWYLDLVIKPIWRKTQPYAAAW